MGYYTTMINGAKAHVFDTKDLHHCEVRLTSSSSLYPLSGMTYGKDGNLANPNDDINKGEYRERGRVNGGLFENNKDKANYKEHYGWEFSDGYKTSCGTDGRADAMQLKDGTILMGDIKASDVNLDDIVWAYSGSHCILQNGNDVLIVPDWRVSYPQGKYCWSWFASRDDGTYIIGAIDASATVDTPSLRNWLKAQGATNAMVNDGGGSAELVVDGIIKNRTSERAIANGLIIYEKIEEDKPDNTAVLQAEIDRLTNLNDALNDKLSRKNAALVELETDVANIMTKISAAKEL